MVKEQKSENGKGLGIRHLQSLWIFLGTAATFAMRVNLSVAIVAMTDNKNANPNFEEFHWDEKIKSYLLGSFFWGYVVTQIPGGYISQRFGAKFLLFFGILFCSLLNILTPWCASFGGWKLLFASRLLQGLCQGGIFPSCHVLLSKWCPPEERGVIASFAYSGSAFGTVTILATSGFIASAIGWPSIFYLSGISGLVWCGIWFFFGSSSPAQCKLVSIDERLMIETSLGKSQNEKKKHLSTPWKKVFTSPPFLSLILVHSTNNWGHWTLLTQIPSYMKGVLGMDIKKNALLSALPYFSMCLMSFAFVAVAKILSEKKYISVEMERKLFNTIGHWVPMLSLVGLGFVKTHATMAVTLLTIGVAFNSAIHLGFQVNHIDLASNFAGTLLGTTNCFGNSMGVFAPLAVGFIVTDEHDPNQWRIVFFIAAGLYFLGNLMFLIFGTTKEQPWNNPGKDEEVNTEELKPIKPEGAA
ncbi:unnamed protein product [Hermetia illucens]|uniref:Putative inorganic phosphate cotransporter n=1 Tax=Hermetia illucens TaxID=343691 RepID=A0A7R8YXP2_HERIL|nr:putative inorganic phosphate cotransporter [Hermetia illucens]CAD7085965.1 unnamed protein product [Hermetia illucens]